MNCDSCFEIGSSHLVCQDYALHGKYEGMYYVIVSDGCSSAEYSEIGAQILCHVAKYYLIFYHQTGLFKECSIDTITSLLGNSILKRADEIRKIYPIGHESLAATLLIAIAIDNFTHVFMWGDGIIIRKYEYGEIEYYNISEINYSGNAPFYLIDDKEQYEKELNIRGIDNPKVFYTFHDFKNVYEKKEYEYNSFDKPFVISEDDFNEKEKLISVTIATDGMSTFKNVNKDPIQLVDSNNSKLGVFSEFSNFKSYDGEFVKRRMKFFKHLVQKKLKWSHYDDLSHGTIYRG